MYKVFDKDMINSEILPHLSIAKHGVVCKACIVEVINSILYKLKPGIQWRLLPLTALFRDVVLSCKTVRQGIPLAMSEPISEEHHNLYKIEKSMSSIFETLREAHIYVDGLFLNADAGFDSKGFRRECKDRGIFSNVCFNKKRTKSMMTMIARINFCIVRGIA